MKWLLLSILFFVGVIMAANVGHANVSCRTLFSKQETLIETIFGVAQHENIRLRRLQATSKGEVVRFLHPLVEHLLSKAEVQIKAEQDPKRETQFAGFVGQCRDRLLRGEMSYTEMLYLPTVVGHFLQNISQERQSFKYLQQLVIEKSEVVEKFVQKGVYPLPMFYTPNFELRNRLWAHWTPPISLSAKPFYSELDGQGFGIVSGVNHDWSHASILLSRVTHPGRAKILRSMHFQMIEVVERLPYRLQRDLGHFVLHQFFAEDYFVFNHYESSKESLQELLVMKRGTIFSHFRGAKFVWLMKALRLYDVRLQIGPEKYVYLSDNGENRLLIDHLQDLMEFTTQLRSDLNESFLKIIEAHKEEFERESPTPKELY